MKTFMLTITAILITISVEAEETWVPTGSLSLGVHNKLVLDGVNYHDESVMFSEVYLQLPLGFWADVWISSGMDNDFSSDYGDEIDYHFGWAGKLSEDVSLNVSASYFDLFDLGSSKRDILKLQVLLEKDVKLAGVSLTPFVKVKHFIPVNFPELEAANIYFVGCSQNIDLTDSISFNHNATLAYDEGMAGGQSDFWEYNAALSLSKGPVTLSPIKLNCSGPLSSDEKRETETVFGMSISYSF
jgi:hypothetical protein